MAAPACTHSRGKGVKGHQAKAREPPPIYSYLRETYSDALEHPGFDLVDFRIEREENVFPMVPPGAAINAMIDHGTG